MNKGPFIFAFFMAFLTRVLWAQAPVNIVPNPSFNLYITCPDTNLPPDQEFHDYYDWFPRWDASPDGLAEFGSPDPFHSCNGYFFQTGNCQPQDLDGGGGVGMGIEYNNPFLFAREFSVVKLLKTLQPYQGYCCSFYIANCQIISQADVYLTNGQMIGFGPEMFIWESSGLNDYRPYLNIAVQNETIYSDTGIWHKIEGNYIADGTEKYLFLGWAEPLSNLTWQLIHDSSVTDVGFNYTLFDSISIVECNAVGMNIDNLYIPNIITPNNDGVNDDWILQHGDPNIPQVGIEIYNQWGELIYQNENYHGEWHGQTHCNKQVSEGVYFYRVTLPPNQQKTGCIYVMG